MTQKFNLTAEYEYVEERNFRTLRSDFISGVSQRRALWINPKRIFNLRWDSANQVEKEYLQSFVSAHQGAAGEFIFQPFDPVPTPDFAGDASQVAGGALGARIYYYQITWVTALGQTRGSTEQSFSLSANNRFKLIVPRFPTNVTKARIYVATSPGNEVFQVEISNPISQADRTWTEPLTGLIAGAAPPSTNTAHEEVSVNLLEDTFAFRKLNAGVYAVQLAFEEIF